MHGTTFADEEAALIFVPEVSWRAADQVSELFKALGHPLRILTLCCLRRGPLSVSELQEALDSRQADVSQNLARLRHAGLVVADRDGRKVIYRLTDDAPIALIDGILRHLEHAGSGIARPDPVGRYPLVTIANLIQQQVGSPR